MIGASVWGSLQCILRCQYFPSIWSTELSFIPLLCPFLNKPTCSKAILYACLVEATFSIFHWWWLGSWLPVWGDRRGPCGQCSWGKGAHGCKYKFLLILNLIFQECNHFYPAPLPPGWLMIISLSHLIICVLSYLCSSIYNPHFHVGVG